MSRSPLAPALLATFLLITASTSLSTAAQPSWRVSRHHFIEPAPAVPEVHASTLVEADDGTLVAAWFGGTKEGNDDVSIYVSRLGRSGTWSAGQVVADGRGSDGSRHATWNPVLHRMDDGTLLLFFKTGPSPREWWGEIVLSRDHGVTWTDRRRLPGAMLGPIKNKPVVLADGRLLCPTSIEYDHERWFGRMEFASPSLARWEATPDLPDPENLGAIQPSVLIHRDGTLQALFRTRARVLAQAWSKDQGRTWSALERTEIPMPNSGIDAVTLDDGSFILVYNRLDPKSDPKSWGERRPLLVAHSTDGRQWTDIATLETLPNRFGYAYPAVIQTRDGRIHLTYTWNRARLKHVALERVQ